MSSSMLAGERRWASSRRGGMTVLGKVAVPKPINLPSQKLENHGLDPNVEIVPKGSLSWGSRPSSSTSNPWVSSAVSPNADGSTVSPHHPSGRPTSGGGLSRPSTAGSDRQEPSASTWGPNSRPSSASGVLTANQSSLTSSRPLSAETRPGSSHLSRFAEPVFDNPVAWGPNGTADKLSIPSNVNDFSLSSGDFPTLGSEKDSTAKSSEPHDHDSHARPGSGSGRTNRNEMVQADHKSGTVDTWTRDSSPPADKWQGEPQHYVNHNVPLQHFDAWRGRPMNAPPGGVWYRGPPPAGPPYPPVPHGGYPMEPFPYYRPQMPPNLANSQSGPQSGPGPRGHHPRNGDFYRPQMPEPFIRPVMPMRQGFYPAPVPYDGYYGPPMGYSPNDRDMPYMGMPPGPHGPPVYNMYPPQNPSEHNDAHFRPGGHGPAGNMFVSEKSDSIPPEEPRGPYKVLRKRDNERDAGLEEDNWEQNLEKNDHPRPSLHKNEGGTDTRRNEDMPSRKNAYAENPSSRMSHNQGYPSESVIVHSPEGTHKSKASNESWGKKSETVLPSFPEVTHDIPSNPNNSSLIQKIEGLNAKVRASDARVDAASGFVRDEQKNRLLVNPKDNSTITFGSISNTGDLANASSFPRQVPHGVRSRPDHHSKGRLNNQDTDGWRKKPPFSGSEVASSVLSQSSAHARTFQVPDNHNSAEPSENPGDSIPDLADGQAQRARMRELAKQRAAQLQKEEEERIREQKAKALAKLEELNRRTLTDVTTQTTEKTATSVSEQDDVNASQKPTRPPLDENSLKQTSGASSGLNANAQTVVQSSENIQKEPVSHDQSSLSKQSVTNVTDAESKAVSLGNDASLYKQKRANHGQKQSAKIVESSVDKSTLIGAGGALGAVTKNHGTNVSGEAVANQESSLPNNPNIMSDSTQPRKRNNKSIKNKTKLDDASAPPDGELAKLTTDSGKTDSRQVDLDPSKVLVTNNRDAMQSKKEQISSLPSEESHGRAPNQYKPQHTRKLPRNPQANRSADRFNVGDVAVWTPVRPQPKEERVDEYSQGTMQDDMPLPAKSVNSAQTNSKNKRAEMERYIPKPVAKELAHQGTTHQSSSPEKSTLEDMTDRENLGSQAAIPVSSSVVPIVESKSVDNKQNKLVKSHGAWKQRGPTELHHDQGFQQSAPVTSNPKKSYHKATSQHEPSNPLPTETVTHEWDPSDGWFMPEDPPTEVAPVTSVVKDEGGVTGKGKRPAYKGQRSTVKNHDINHKDASGAEVDQTDRPASSKENRSSHWQPKPHAYRGAGSNANSEVKGVQPDEAIAEYSRGGPHDGYQESRRERKPASYRGRPHSPNQGHGHMEDEPSFSKYGGQNNRTGGQDDRRRHNQHNNANMNRERPRQNLQYEYQPVGSNNNTNKASNLDAHTDASGNAGPRYKERSSGQQSRQGGGNFYGRQ